MTASPDESATSEYNTAELSDLTGLSKILRADDSIADRVRCLLEDDGDSEAKEKPELLSSANRNNPVDDELKAEVASLLQEHGETEKLEAPLSNNSGAISDGIEEDNMKDADGNGNQETVELAWTPAEEEGEIQSITISGRRSGDGADFVPNPAPQDFTDDIMNISDSTEYSDLPKVVDNPVKQGITEIRSASQPMLEGSIHCGISPASRGDSSSRNIEKADVIADSDPDAPRFLESPKQLCELERYVSRRNPIPRELNEGAPGAYCGDPIHSTPCIRSTDGVSEGPAMSRPQLSTLTKPNETDGRRSHEGNITVRTKESRNTTVTPRVSSPNHKSKHRRFLPKNLGDEELLAKVRETVTENAEKSGDLKGPHTASENSIASTVDSLALQVKNLLKEEELAQKFSPADLSGINVNEVSQNSNYSEEINNFEQTSLWKYTRQFLPGALTPSREIQPLAKFSDSSIQANKMSPSSRITLDSSSPETYRLARHSISPLTAASHRHGPPCESDGVRYTRNQEELLFPSSTKVSSKSRSLAHDSSTSTVPHQDYSMDRNDCCEKVQSRIIGRYDRYPQQHNFTPQNESYKPLEPEFSQTPYTFVTPRKVAWEPERDTPVLKYNSPTAKEKVALRTSFPPSAGRSPQARTPPVQERSAYFSQRTLHDVKKSPQVLERSASIRFQRVTPECADSMRKLYAPQKDKFTSTKDSSSSATEDQIFVKPVTPPSRNPLARNECGKLDRLTAAKSVLMKPVKLSPKAEHSSPKFVHFRESCNQATPYYGSKSPMNPEYSFTTPLVSTRPPKRNITPKVEKEKPRPTRSLPTYDQLVAEQEKQAEDKSKSELLETLPKTNSFTEKKADKFPENPNQSIEEGDFSALKPEVCLDGSDKEDEATSPRTLVEGNRTLSLSDTDLHRRATHSGDSWGRGLSTSAKIANGAVVHLSGYSSSGEEHEKEGSVETTSSPPTPTEPAPLPYVRLCKKNASKPVKSKTQQRHSISTEKVQHLLMKEQSVGRQPVRSKNAGVSASLPITNGSGYASTDDELVALLETFSTKVPLMEKLLKKLYERNLEKQTTISQDEVDSDADCDDRKKVDQSVQTFDDLVTGSPGVNRPKPKAVKVRKHNQSGKLCADSSSQTSFQRESRAHANKSAGPMDANCSELETESVGETEENHRVYTSKILDEDKENGMRGSKVPCAFFVDLTPEKLAKAQEPKKSKQPPVAWYEPYEYMPPWRKQNDTSRATLGFVDVNIQDAFLNKKRDFVLKSWERQEDIAIRAEERKLKELEERIHDQISALHKEKAYAAARAQERPQSAPAAKEKKDRTFGWKEMRIASKQKYEALPEVVARKKEAERKKYYELNRKRAEMYKRKLTRLVVQKQRGKLASEVR